MHSSPPSVRRTLVSVVALCLIPMVVAGCSSSPASSTTSTTATTTTAGSTGHTLCTAVEPAQIASITGLEVRPAQIVSSKISVTCAYKGTVDLSKSVIIIYSIDVTPTEFTNQAKKANSEHGPIIHVTDLGDAAYYFTFPSQGSTITTLVFVHGEAEIVITSTANVTQLSHLAELILSRFSSSSKG